MTFGEKLVLYRKTNNKMTQEELANIVHTTKQVISRYEKGERTPKIDTVQEYARKLNLPILYLVDDDIDTIPSNDGIPLSDHESKIIAAYRHNLSIQPFIDKLLDVEPEQNTSATQKRTYDLQEILNEPWSRHQLRVADDSAPPFLRNEHK